MERSVFLVEDEGPLRALLASHLRKRGHRVLEAGDAEGAVRHLVQEPPFDLLITDVHLPNLSGIELLRLLQAHSPMKPVLVITGDDDGAIAKEVIGRGAAGYLLKPFELTELDAAVAQALRHLELIERMGEAQSPPSAFSELGVPPEWLEVADARCGAGVGHGRRVERLGTVLAKRAGVEELREIAAAARLHEIGHLVASGHPGTGIPALSATILEYTAVTPLVRALIAGMAEWDSPVAGGAAAAARLALMTADGIDHRAMQGVQEGAFPPKAILDAIDDVARDVARAFGADAGRALEDAREVLSAMWILSRGGYPSAPPARRAHQGLTGRRESRD